MKTLLSILTRLAGLITFLIVTSLCALPFFVIIVIWGIDIANRVVSFCNRIPLNWLLGDNAGDYIYALYSHTDKEE